MQLHNTCTWTKAWPDCNSNSCAGITLPPIRVEYASSGTGSGGAYCNTIGSRDIWGYPSKLTREQRKLCCREDIENQRWNDCKWYDRYGIIEQGWPSDACYGSCPENKVRVAKELDSKQCSQGARVRCCTDSFHSITKRESESSQELRALLDRFLDDPTCTDDHKSDDYQYQARLAYHIKKLIFETADETRIDIWDQTVGLGFTNLKMSKLREWATTDGEALLLGNINLSRAVMCGLHHYDALIGGNAVTCPANSDSLARRFVIDPLLDIGDAADGSPIAPAIFMVHRGARGNATLWHALVSDQDMVKRGLKKRGNEEWREYDAYSPVLGDYVQFGLSMMRVLSTSFLTTPSLCRASFESDDD